MKRIFFLFNISLLFLFGCTSSEADKKPLKTAYIAISGADTAWLDLTIKGTQFKGVCEINFNNKYRDSGDVRGAIKGDTLLGDFHYLHYGLEWKRISIALLKKDNKLIMGKGVQGVFLDIPYFKPESPIDYDSVKFVFQNR